MVAYHQVEERTGRHVLRGSNLGGQGSMLREGFDR